MREPINMDKSFFLFLMVSLPLTVFSQIEFSIENSNDITLKVVSILKEQSNFYSVSNSESISIKDIANGKNINQSSDGIYLVSSNILHFGSYLLFKNGKDFSLFYNIPTLEMLFNEVVKDKRTKKENLVYLKKIFSYYKSHLYDKNENEPIILPKDSVSYINLYRKNHKKKLLLEKQNSKKVYLKFKKRIEDDNLTN